MPFGKNPKIQENILLQENILQWRFYVHATQLCTGQQTIQDNMILLKGQCKKKKMDERLEPTLPPPPQTTKKTPQNILLYKHVELI